jgi:hypothetical protein
LALALIAAAGALQPVARAQQPPKQVGLVIDFGDDYETYCVEFTESDLTGYDVLLKLELKSDLTIVADTSNPMGVTICDINETSGCPASNCFCQCQGSPCVYWSYHYLENGSWRYSQEGASNRQVHDGDVEGWGWGEGAINTSGHKPPVIPFDEICDPPATDTPVPTETPIPPTETPAPTDTPAPTTPPEPEVWFRLDENPIAAGSCTILRWDTAHVTEVYLDDESVSRNGSREVCPTTTQEYTLRVVSAADEQKHRLTLGVTGDADPTPTPTSPPASAPAQSSPTPPPPTATIAPTEPQQTAPASTPSPSPTPPVASATPTASPSPTPLQVAALDAALSATPEAGPATPTTSAAEASTPEKAPSESEQQNLPIGYVAFSLIVGGLLGWLIYIFKFQK